MKMLRLAAAGASALLAASLALAGCSAPQPSNDNSAASFSYRIPDRFRAWLLDDKWFPVVQQKAGVTVNVVDGGPEEQYYQQLDLSLTSGKVDDVVVATSGQVDVYGPQGAFTDLAPLISKDAPNISKYLADNPEFKRLVTTSDGKIFGLPTESPRISEVTMYRADQFSEAGISSPPRDLAEFTADLKTLKKKFAGVQDYYPLTGRDGFVRFLYAVNANFGVTDNQVVGVNGSSSGSPVTADVESAGYRQLISWFHQLYVDGLVDPEWIAGANTEESWQTKMLTGKATVTSDFFTRPSWFMNNGGPQNDSKYSIAVMPAFHTADGQQGLVPANPRWNLNRTVAVSSTSTNAAAVVKFLDYLYSDEGQRTMHYGVEGTSYEMKNGKPVYTVDFAKEANQDKGVAVWNFLQDRLTFPAPVDNTAYYAWADELTRSFSEKYFTTYLKDTPIIKYTPDQQKQRADLLATLEPYATAELTKFVTGKRDFSTWDTFLSELNDKGYTTLHEIDQAAWSAGGN